MESLQQDVANKNRKTLPTTDITSLKRKEGQSFRLPSQPKKNAMNTDPSLSKNVDAAKISSTSGINNSHVLHTNMDDTTVRSSGKVSRKRMVIKHIIKYIFINIEKIIIIFSFPCMQESRVTSSTSPGSDVSNIFRR